VIQMNRKRLIIFFTLIVLSACSILINPYLRKVMASEQFTSYSLSETVAQAPLTPTPSSQITPLNPSSKPMTAGKENGISGQVIGIIGTILTAFVAGGSSPWWWSKVFGEKGKSDEKVSGTPERYEYEEDGNTKAFLHFSKIVWKEKNEFDKEINTFKEIERDSDFITIYDKSRDMRIKIPIEGGQILVTWPKERWADVPYRYVAKKSSTN
jgi:hypothetical protein